jgi:hypothetical protein
VSQSRNGFDQLPTNVMRDEELLALVRQTRLGEAATEAGAAAGSSSAPTAVYGTIDIECVARERMNALGAPLTEPDAVSAEVAATGAARPAEATRAVHEVRAVWLVLLLLAASCLAYLTL